MGQKKKPCVCVIQHVEFRFINITDFENTFCNAQTIGIKKSSRRRRKKKNRRKTQITWLESKLVDDVYQWFFVVIIRLYCVWTGKQTIWLLLFTISKINMNLMNKQPESLFFSSSSSFHYSSYVIMHEFCFM